VKDLTVAHIERSEIKERIVIQIQVNAEKAARIRLRSIRAAGEIFTLPHVAPAGSYL
jgi:hypothetical protein